MFRLFLFSLLIVGQIHCSSNPDSPREPAGSRQDRYREAAENAIAIAHFRSAARRAEEAVANRRREDQYTQALVSAWCIRSEDSCCYTESNQCCHCCSVEHLPDTSDGTMFCFCFCGRSPLSNLRQNQVGDHEVVMGEVVGPVTFPGMMH